MDVADGATDPGRDDGGAQFEEDDDAAGPGRDDREMAHVEDDDDTPEPGRANEDTERLDKDVVEEEDAVVVTSNNDEVDDGSERLVEDATALQEGATKMGGNAGTALKNCDNSMTSWCASLALSQACSALADITSDSCSLNSTRARKRSENWTPSTESEWRDAE